MSVPRDKTSPNRGPSIDAESVFEPPHKNLVVDDVKCYRQVAEEKTRRTPFKIFESVLLLFVGPNFSHPVTYEKQQISHILNIWNTKCRSNSPRRKTELTPFDRKYLCVLLIFFHNLASGKMGKLTNFTFVIGNVGQCYGREKLDLRSSIANFRLCIADFFHNFSIGHRTNFTYFKHLKWKM